MKKYISHKIVDAAKILNVQEVTGESAGFRLTLEGEEDAILVPENFYARGGPYEDDLGYLVVYAAGHKSWTPSEPFEAGYTELGSALTFSEALEALKVRLRVSRSGWSGKYMWIIMLDETDYSVEAYARFNTETLAPFIAMRTADGSMVPWAPSQTDMLSNDWSVVR